MAKHIRTKKRQKLVYLQENMEFMTEFDHKIFDFMFRSQKSDIDNEIRKWFKRL